uniref:CRAL-TRIO domain-containing protein n=1 Tax=Chelydra serpentina TaxID=8475 RepID=A0A8C3SJQ2_CHESE
MFGWKVPGELGLWGKVLEGTGVSSDGGDSAFPGLISPPAIQHKAGPRCSLVIGKSAEKSPGAFPNTTLPPPTACPFPSADELPRARRLDSSLFEEKLSEGRMVDVEDKDGRKWRIFLTDEREQKVDLSVVEPYKRVISHGGYYGEGLNAIILFASCYLPHSSIPDYQYVMEHLFRYIIGTLEVMVAESYILVCLNGATLRSQIPSFGWIKQCYRTIDRRLRKNLKAMIIVHPTWYVKALMAVIRPFLSIRTPLEIMPRLLMGPEGCMLLASDRP